MVQQLIHLSRHLLSILRNNMRLKYKLMVSYSALILLPTLVIGIASQYISQRYMVDAEKQALRQSMEQLNTTIDFFFETYMNKSEMIFANQPLQKIITTPNNNIADVVSHQNEINEIMNGLISDVRYPYMQKAYFFGGTLKAELYVQNESLTSFGGEVMPFSAIQDEPWCRALFEQKKMFTWQSNVPDGYGTRYLVMNRRLVDFQTSRDIGILRLFIPAERVGNIIRNNIINEAISFSYLDENNVEILSIGKAFQNDPSYLNTIQGLQLHEGINEVRLDGEQMIVGYMNSPITQWKLIYLVPIGKVTERTQAITTITVGTMLVSLLLCVLLATRLAGLITRRIDILVEKTNQIGEDSLSVRLVLPGNDEISQLDKNFNRMVERINKLIQNEYTSKLQVNKAKLELYQEQINPHLLYNTLSTIGLLAKEHDQADIARITNHLSQFYRSALSRGAMITTLRQELDLVGNYIEIMKFVYGMAIETVIEVDEDILDCATIKLLLQPIVENSILHGLRPNGGGTITLIGNAVPAGPNGQESIRLEISDDGFGMEEAQVAAFRAVTGLNQTEKGYGFSNVLRRLALYFGDQYQVQIDSLRGAGTTIVLVIPHLTEAEIKRKVSE